MLQQHNRILKVVKDDLPKWFESAQAFGKTLGADQSSSLEKVKLFFPIPKYYLALPEEKKIKSDSELISNIKPVGYFDIPVDWGSNHLVFITVAAKTDSMKVIGVGGNAEFFKAALRTLGYSDNLEIIPKEIYYIDGQIGWNFIIASGFWGLKIIPADNANLQNVREGKLLKIYPAVKWVNSRK